MADFPDPGEFFDKFRDMKDSIDPEMLQAILEVVPPELVQDVLAIIQDPSVQAGIAQLQGALDNAQDITFELSESLPAALEELRSSMEAALEGAQGAALGIDPAKIQALTSHLPAVGVNVAKMALARPEAAPVRQQVTRLSAMLLAQGQSTPGTQAAAVALGAQALLSQYGDKVGGTVAQAVQFVLPETYLTTAEAVIKGFADARGVDYEDELGRWQQDASTKTLFSGAANRYAKAKGLTALPDAERLAITGRVAGTMEALFAGVAADWEANGPTAKVKANAVKNSRTAFRSIDGIAAAALKSNETPEAPKRTRKPAAKKPGTGGPAKGPEKGGKELG